MITGERQNPLSITKRYIVINKVARHASVSNKLNALAPFESATVCSLAREA